eukprot:3396505-Prymnesium_polylepis.1
MSSPPPSCARGKPRRARLSTRRSQSHAQASATAQGPLPTIDGRSPGVARAGALAPCSEKPQVVNGVRLHIGNLLRSEQKAVSENVSLAYLKGADA